MKQTDQFSIVLVTAPNRTAARRLAKAALAAQLVACANLVPGIESHYWWKNRVESSAEVLIIFKTTRKHLAALEKLIVVNHPYDTPEFVALPLTGGNEPYLQWLKKAVQA
jgi:periplasmic divalent cation tolerance protein